MLYRSRWLLIWSVGFVAAALAFIGFVDWFRIDPLDRFEVIKVVSDTKMTRHAVVYRYHHADSSSDDIAVWITTRAPPTVGSKRGEPGEPALVWTGWADDLDMAWPSENRPLLVGVARPIEVVEGAGSCFYMDPRPGSILCLDPHRVEVQPDQTRK